MKGSEARRRGIVLFGCVPHVVVTGATGRCAGAVLLVLWSLTLCVVAGDLAALRETEDRHRTLYAESQQREKVLVRRLAAKEQEMQDYAVCHFFSFFPLRICALYVSILYFYLYYSLKFLKSILQGCKL